MLLPEEFAQRQFLQERQRTAEVEAQLLQERQQAEQERADLIERLRAKGIDPNEVLN